MKKQSVTTPKISVIIPVYNVEKYLRQCLDCVVAQTLREIEIICVDDGSTDDSLKILNEYAASDKRITVLKQQNKGAGAARNAGMAAAKGEFLSFLDSDDFFELNMLETMYNKAQEDGSDIVVCEYSKYDQQLGKETAVANINKTFLNNSPIVPEEFGSNLFEVCYPNPWSKIFKRELLINNKLQFENLKSCNDITCVMTAEALAGKISAVNKTFVYYRCNTGSQTSTNRFGRNECFISAAAALEKNLKHFGLYDKFYEKLRYEMDSCLRWETKGDIKLLQDLAQKHLSPRLYNDLYAEYNGPKVSVIIPVYNVEKYLRQCLNSVVNQTLREIEIICIDDGSTDNSPKILKEYAAKDKRIKILQQPNLGAYPARNKGIDYAGGEFIAFMDSDDTISENYYQLLYEQAKCSKAEIVITDNVLVHNNGKFFRKNLGISPEQTTVNNIDEKGKMIVASGVMWNKIYRRDFIEKYHIRCLDLQGSSGDNYWCTVCLFYAQNIKIIHNALYNYILRDNSITQSPKSRKHFVVFDVYQALDDKLKKETTAEEWKLWSQYINKRKLIDFQYHYYNMANDCKDDFWQIALSKLKNIPIIVSLTSYPARINKVYHTIYTLLNQSVQADKIVLYLGKDKFLHQKRDLPQDLLDLCGRKFEIHWVKKDLHSFTKLIPALKEYPDSVIVTADDDVLYPYKWLELLMLSYIKNPQLIHCHRVHRIEFEQGIIKPYKHWEQCCRDVCCSYNNFLTGVGGVLYPPHCLHPDVLDEEKFMRLCPQADDIWFWAMAVKNDFPIQTIENNIAKLNVIDGTQNQALWHTNVDEGKNDIQLHNVLNEYPEILDKLDKNISISNMMAYKINKSVHTYKLFNFIPFLTVKQRCGRKVYKILGLPIWKVRKMADNLTAKYYFCGIPLLKKQTKENQITTKYKLFGLPFLKVSKKKIEQGR